MNRLDQLLTSRLGDGHRQYVVVHSDRQYHDGNYRPPRLYEMRLEAEAAHRIATGRDSLFRDLPGNHGGQTEAGLKTPFLRSFYKNKIIWNNMQPFSCMSG